MTNSNDDPMLTQPSLITLQTPPAIMSIFRLIAGANSYDWGKTGKTSKAGLYACADPDFHLDENKPYSEAC